MATDRSLTVTFPLRGLNGLNYNEILEGLSVGVEHVQAIQLTFSTCRITVDSRQSKQCLKENGLEIRGNPIQVWDANEKVTSVTIKDAPFELSDSFIVANLEHYGLVVEESLT